MYCTLYSFFKTKKVKQHQQKTKLKETSKHIDFSNPNTIIRLRAFKTEIAVHVTMFYFILNVDHQHNHRLISFRYILEMLYFFFSFILCNFAPQ